MNYEEFDLIITDFFKCNDCSNCKAKKAQTNTDPDCRKAVLRLLITFPEFAAVPELTKLYKTCCTTEHPCLDCMFANGRCLTNIYGYFQARRADKQEIFNLISDIYKEDSQC